MKNTRTVEISVGIFVAAGLIAAFFMAMQVSNLSGISSESGFKVTARFENIGGLKVKSPVTMAGVKIGRITQIDFDNETFEGIITININATYKIPADTSASIFTSGLLGEQYIALQPGGDETILKAGDVITLTQSAIVLEQIIGQFLFSKAEEGLDNPL